MLPVVSVPVLIAGGTIPNGLADAAWLGLAIFAVMVAVGWWVLGSDRPLIAAGHAVERIVTRVRPKRPLAPGLPERLIAERDAVLRALGSQALYAIIASLGRWLFDYLTLLAALTAVGANPNPVLVLLAYAISQMLASVPITPGGSASSKPASWPRWRWRASAAPTPSSRRSHTGCSRTGCRCRSAWALDHVSPALPPNGNGHNPATPSAHPNER